MLNVLKERRAIDYLKAFEPSSEPYYLCYSGGKDSDCIKILAQLAGVKFEAVHNLTTVDAPETVYYVRSQPDVKVEKPKRTMWELIVEKGTPPTRLLRYCCSDFKEIGGMHRLKITGVRWAESAKRSESSGVLKVVGKPKTMQEKAEDMGLDYQVSRQNGLVLNDDNDKNRRFVEQCYRTASVMVNPIVDWTDADVWSFLRYYGCLSNPLYHCGYSRVGCVGCPMAGKARYAQFARYPKYRANYVRAFDRMLAKRLERGMPLKGYWKDGEAVMRWWLDEDPLQMTMEDVIEG